MSQAAIRLLVFGIYVVLNGLGFLLAPNTALGLFGFPATTEPWIHVVGMLSLILGYFYIQAARKELTELMRLSVHARASVIVFTVVLVALGIAPPTFLMLGIVDLAGAIWTALALRSK
jgi:hypothetical protein